MGWFSSDETVTIVANETSLVILAFGVLVLVYLMVKLILKYNRLVTLNILRDQAEMNK